MTQRVLVDANVLFSKTTMDWLILLRGQNTGMFSLYSTEDIMAEVINSMRRAKPRAEGHRTRHRAELIRRSLDEVLSDYPGNLPFSGSDEHDYHVHAAAVAGRAEFLLTANSPGDFTSDPDREQYTIITPDDFFLLVIDSNQECLVPVVSEQKEYWAKKPQGLQLDDALINSGCPDFAQRVRSTLQDLAIAGW